MPEGIEDNYVDDQFLKGMAHKNSFPNLHYPVMIKNTLEIIHVLNSVFFQVSMFYILVNSSNEPESTLEYVFLFTTIILSCFGYIIYNYYKIEANLKDESITFAQICKIIFGWDFVKNVKTILFLSMILNLVIPVLSSLTVTYTDDTIILDYAIFVFIHLLYYDFEMVNQVPDLSMPESLIKSVSPSSQNKAQ